MDARTVGVGLLTAFSAVATAQAQDNDVAAGEKLFVSQCKICHGSAAAPEASQRVPLPHVWPVQLAMQANGGATTDFSPQMLPGPKPKSNAGEHVAFAPPFGPNLRGVYGRPAGSVAGFDYSPAFLKALRGMEWNDATLNVWLLGTQAWVPGVFMFYRQPDEDIRRKIIAYLKANS
jgi:cytochrome c2